MKKLSVFIILGLIMCSCMSQEEEDYRRFKHQREMGEKISRQNISKASSKAHDEWMKKYGSKK